jgi:hypothetical protein
VGTETAELIALRLKGNLSTSDQQFFAWAVSEDNGGRSFAKWDV